MPLRRPAHLPHLLSLPPRPIRYGAAVTVGAVLLLCGCAVPSDTTAGKARPAGRITPTTAAGRPGVAVRSVRGERLLPGVGPEMLARVPDSTSQVLLVTGTDRDGSTATARLYRRTPDGWEPTTGSWPAHNALKGWTHDHRIGDLRSPVGAFTLTDAGGLLPDPGTRLPYDRSTGFRIAGTGSRGEPLAGSFDYVVAIDYNRQPGTTPLDWTRPEGAAKGGGIWVHVDHHGPTQACVSIARDHMKELLRALGPSRKPMIVMGDAASLAR
ncbi:L,D-peptidoglycan transpeptidase YkuD (ErfK/YbiS/YcfS/YnhG family) [Streptomyces sp. B3I7]|uniref:hypothetical protein n=1 Tax=Streptomyces sp. B3I7 TaxID=3042269 RepID=UPI00278B6BD6|nr:hypothetical protein [Streptomyces sp. B3I7]MDQ0808892.1 L,D-peptidoglycan transpeptidase YkuD (ErfK/YbiS/YcfS/YnhG family) [Streptomyces sp. B3I7]